MNCATFDELLAGFSINVFNVNPVSTNAIRLEGGEFWAYPYTSIDGRIYGTSGFAKVRDDGLAGGSSGNDLEINNVLLCFGVNFGQDVTKVSFTYTNYGGQLNLRVNDNLKLFHTWLEFHEQTIAGVHISHREIPLDPSEGSGIRGIVELNGKMVDQGYYGNIGIGGQELFIDDFCWEPTFRPIDV